VFRLPEAAAALGADRRGPDVEITRVVTDSRAVRAGDLFVALRGERHDAHAFVDDALAAGAAAAVVSDAARVTHPDAPLLVVDDTLDALQRLAAWWRGRFTLPLIGVTGSNGKTTVKEMLASVLAQAAGDAAVLATEGNLNNAIGVPLMLLRLRAAHRFCVLEMGMNHLGEIRLLTRLARPTVALINNAGTAHIGEVGSRDNIARAKGEIFEGLTRDGVRVINADDTYATFWQSLAGGGARVVAFSSERIADVWGTVAADADGSRITFTTPSGSGSARLRVPGLHNARNALAAVAAATAVGLAPDVIAPGLERYAGTRGRMQRRDGPAGARVVDDTYNANPDSMKAALDWLATQPGTRVFVMGDMGELGADEASGHAEVMAHAAARGIDTVCTLGAKSRDGARAAGVASLDFDALAPLVDALRARCAPGTTVLVKGSRSARMERVVDALLATATADGAHA
jgi:UDP-N-acetylmuramoyl-tripeptide--D-alanyl-D-alanine ligase